MSLRLVRHLTALPLADVLLIGRVTALVVGVRLALATLPYSRVVRLVERGAPEPTASELTTNAFRHRRRIVSYTAGVSRRLLGDKPCLTQALVAQRLLREVGQPTTLRIGVAPGQEGGLRAHAWLEDRGQVVIGAWGQDQAYVLLRPLASAPRTRAA